MEWDVSRGFSHRVELQSIMDRHFLNTPLVYELGTKFIGYIPRSISYAFAHILADISYIFYRTAADKVKRNFRMLFPDASESQLSRRARQLFRNYAEYLVDYGRFAGLDKETILKKIVHFDGEDNLIEALNMRKGLILLTAHLGNWELGGIFFDAYGLKVNVVTAPDDDAEIDNNRRRYRERHGVKTITVGDSPFSTVNLVNALSNNEVIAMLIDRYNEGRDSVAVDFFDKPARFPRGPFILSRMTGAPVVVAFVIKEQGAYKGIVREPFIVEDKGMEGETVEKVVRIFEKYIVKYPDQWYDFQ